MIFGSKLPSSFCQQSTLFSSIYYAASKNRQAVITLKIYNSGLDRLCATHFLTLLHTPLGVDPYFWNHWARSTNQPLCCCVTLRWQVGLFLNSMQSLSTNRLSLRFRKYTTAFTLRVDWVGQTYAGLFRGMYNFPELKKIFFIISVNFVVNPEKLDRQITNRLWEAGFVQVAYKTATVVAFHSI